MQKIKNSLLLIFSFICTTLLAQTEIQVKKGPELKDPPKTYISGIIGEKSDGIFCLRKKTGLFGFKVKEMYLENYGTDLNVKNTSPLQLPEIDGKELSLETIFSLDGKFVVFASFFDKKADENTLYMGTTDNTGKVASMQELCKVVSKKKRNKGGFDITLSKDSSKILVTKHEKFDRKEDEKLEFIVLDKNLNTVWRKYMQLPYKDKDYEIAFTLVDKKGNLHMISEVEVPRKEREKGDPSLFYEIFSYFHEIDKVKQYEISLGDNVITSITMRLDKNDNLIAGGLYSERRAWRMKGVFYSRIDPATQQVVSVSKKEFSTEFLAQFMSEKKAAKGKELWNFSLNDIITREDGGAVLIAEYYRRIVTHTQDKNGNWRTTVTYYYNDLIVTNINPEGNIDWFAKVPKRQRVTRTYSGYYTPRYTYNNPDPLAKYLGIATMVSGDKLYIIYNDNLKNLGEKFNPKKPKWMVNPKKAATTVVTLTLDGNMSKTTLFPAKDKSFKSILTPKFNLQTSNTSLVLTGENLSGKKYRFYHLTLK